jgi:DivIVA domain-containing protein
VTLFFLVVILLVIGVVVAVAVGHVSGGLSDAVTSVPVRELPDSRLTPKDLDDLRFETALRGYRMEQVDAALNRVRDELARREEEATAVIGELDDVRADLLVAREQLRLIREG